MGLARQVVKNSYDNLENKTPHTLMDWHVYHFAVLLLVAQAVTLVEGKLVEHHTKVWSATSQSPGPPPFPVKPVSVARGAEVLDSGNGNRNQPVL